MIQLRHLQQFLRTLYYSPVPRPGQDLLLQYTLTNQPCEYRLKCIDSHKIASVPEDVSRVRFAVQSDHIDLIDVALINSK
jgi:hypothetical protein